MLRLQATADIPEEHLEDLLNGIGRDHFVESVSKRYLLSTDPPSFIEIAATLISWKAVFVASGTVFFTTISKRLADDLYDHKKAIAESLFGPVRKIAAAIRKALDDTPRGSHFQAKITSTDGNITAILKLKSEDEAEIAFKLACLYAAAEQVIEKLSESVAQYHGRVTQPIVDVSRTGEVTVSCYGGLENDPIRFTVRLFER